MRYLFGFLYVCALGVVPLVGCSETTGNGGSGGTAGDGGSGGTAGSGGAGGSAASGGTGGTPLAGACTSQDDLETLCDPQFVHVVSECGKRAGLACLWGDPEALFECLTTSTSQCTQDDTSISKGCGDCFGAAVACVNANCPRLCIGDDDSQLCLACRTENCNAPLYQCAGDIVSGCDGDLWCQRVDCDDRVDCTEDVCNPTDGICSSTPLDDETPCAGGVCQSGACALSTSVLPCTEQGIRNAIAAGGGPYTFDCDGTTPVVTDAEIVIDNDVILDGEGKLTVHGNGDHRVFLVASVTVLQGLEVTGGVDSGVWVEPAGTLTLTDSTVSGNADGIHNLVGTVTVTNSTVSWNKRGIINSFSATLTITNSTVSGNAEIGVLNGGNEVLGWGTLTLKNSIVDGDCGGRITSNGYNIESPGNTCGFDQEGDQPRVTEMRLNLGELADNGGGTRTHKPGDDGGFGSDSAAIDKIPEADCEVTTDQRGEPRPETGGTMCDVGSVEVQP